MKEYRVKAFHSRQDIFSVRQILQVKKRFFFIPYWETIDEETVPRGCVMQHNILGSTDWKSKFRDIPNVTFIK